MSEHTERFLRQLCTGTRGMHADGMIDYLLVGRDAGLTDAETRVAVRELAADGYVTHGIASRAVFLTDTGAFWCRRDQRAVEHIEDMATPSVAAP